MNIYVKRYFTLLLMTALMLTGLSSCSKNDEYGEIGDADIGTEEEAKAADSLFTKEDNPFSEYTYRTVDFDNAKMTFDIPKAWKETIVNQSCLRYDVPGDDGIFPGATLYVKCLFNYIAEENDLDPFSSVASELGKPMSAYITGLPYPYREGYDTWIEGYSTADETMTPACTSDKNAASLKVTEDVVLINKVTGDVTALSGFNFVAGYFRWEGFPVMIATVVPTDWTDDAKSMVEYIMSSVAYKKQTVPEMTKCSYRKITLDLPSDFSSSSTEGNIFRTSCTEVRATSSMSLGIFSVPESAADLNVDYIQTNYSDQLASLLLDPEYMKDYYPATSCYEYEGGTLADEKAAFSANVNLATDRYDYTGAENPYGMGEMRYMDMFVIERNGQNYMIACLYSRQQEQVAARVIKSAIQSLSVN